MTPPDEKPAISRSASPTKRGRKVDARKRAAITELLLRPEVRSDSSIAREVGASPTTVGKIRAGLGREPGRQWERPAEQTGPRNGAVRFSAGGATVRHEPGETIFCFHTHRGQRVEVALWDKMAIGLAREILCLGDES